MNSTDFDIAIVGGGFAGSILAQVARQLGHRVLLLERGRHPRFVIGESSTPVANLLLEELGARYALPHLCNLAKYGAWQRSHPDIPCGLKRGFSFYHHQPGLPWRSTPDRSNELLVAASPSDAIADTHWYRPDFDAFLFRTAAALGAETLEGVSIDRPEFRPGSIRLSFTQGPVQHHASTRVLLDATGPNGFLHTQLGLPDSTPAAHRGTSAVFNHFTQVERWSTLHPAGETPPFPPDDAALHHVWEDGWMWVLRFNNGITSAGFATRNARAQAPAPPGHLWNETIQRFPSIARMFHQAKAVQPTLALPRLAFRTSQAAGPGWAMLPIAAGFVDPLLSTGFPLSLLGIERLAATLEKGVTGDFSGYASEVLGDLDLTFELIDALYRAMPDPETFTAITRLYFTAAIFSETARRLGKPQLAPGFLLRHHPGYGPAMRACLVDAGRLPPPILRDRIAALTEPFDLAGLGDTARRGWFPCLASDLHSAAHRIPASTDEIQAMLERTGFNAS